MLYTQAQTNIRNSSENGAASIIKHAIIPTREQLITTTIRAQNGDPAARRDIINMTSRLAYNRAQAAYLSWSPKLPASCLFCDVYQSAIEGILIAVQKYDPTRGNTLTTVAEPWIRQRVQRYIYTQISHLRINKDIITSGLDPENPIHANTMLSIETTNIDAYELETPLDENEQTIGRIDAQMLNKRLKEIDHRLPGILHLSAQHETPTDTIGEAYNICGQRVRKIISRAEQELREEYAPEPTTHQK